MSQYASSGSAENNGKFSAASSGAGDNAVRNSGLGSKRNENGAGGIRGAGPCAWMQDSYTIRSSTKQRQRHAGGNACRCTCGADGGLRRIVCVLPPESAPVYAAPTDPAKSPTCANARRACSTSRAAQP